MVVEHNPCLSGGALEIFLEPQLPAPRIVVVGGLADRARRSPRWPRRRATTCASAPPTSRAPDRATRRWSSPRTARGEERVLRGGARRRRSLRRAGREPGARGRGRGGARRARRAARRSCTRPPGWTSAPGRRRRSRSRSWPSWWPSTTPHPRPHGRRAAAAATDPICGMEVAVTRCDAASRCRRRAGVLLQ